MTITSSDIGIHCHALDSSITPVIGIRYSWSWAKSQRHLVAGWAFFIDRDVLAIYTHLKTSPSYNRNWWGIKIKWNRRKLTLYDQFRNVFILFWISTLIFSWCVISENSQVEIEYQCCKLSWDVLTYIWDLFSSFSNGEWWLLCVFSWLVKLSFIVFCDLVDFWQLI